MEVEVVGERGVRTCEAEAVDSILHENVAYNSWRGKKITLLSKDGFNITKGDKDNSSHPPICFCYPNQSSFISIKYSRLLLSD